MGWLIVAVLWWQSLGWPQVGGDALIDQATAKPIFGEQVLFQAHLRLATPPQEVLLLIAPEGQPPLTVALTPTPDGQLTYTWELVGRRLTPFAHVVYWFQAKLASGEVVESSRYQFVYADDRFTWQSLEEPGIQVGWVEGDLAFGQAALQAAQNGLKSAQSLLDVEPPSPLQVYIYPDIQSLQSALNLSGTPWLAGHASPETGIVLVAVSPGPDQVAEMERQIPHEIAHLLQYRLMGEAYGQLPLWLAEGMASLAELYPNPDYQRALDRAVQEDHLLAMPSLCRSFPRESAAAFLAYAQSASFVRYLQARFGRSGLTALVRTYQDGLGCEEGVQAGLGLSLSQLEREWLEDSLGVNPWRRAWRHLWPYVVLGALVMLPVLFSLRGSYPRHSHLPQKEEP